MPPPAAYIDITSIPFNRTVTQAEFNGGTFGDTTNEVFFRKVASVPEVLGMRTDSGGTFTPRTTVYESDGSTIVDGPRNGTAGAWSAFLSAGTYYIKIVRVGGGASDFDFTSDFDTLPLDDVTVEQGDIIINDDLDRPGTIISSTGTVKGFSTKLPGGEMGAILPSGVSIWHDRYGRFGSDKLAVLDANLNYIGGVDAGITGVTFPKFSADDEKFYVMNDAGDLWTVSDAAVATDLGYFFPLTHDVPQAIAVNAAGTLLYWVALDEDGVVRTLNLGDFSDGPDLYTISGFDPGNDKVARTANTHPGEMFVLDDGSVVFWSFDASELEFHLRHVSAAGSLLHDIVYADPEQVDHIARIIGNTTQILIWLYTSGDFDEGQFGTLTFSTGLITGGFTNPLFEGGVNMTGGPEMFGISTSCGMVLMGEPTESSPSPGSPGGGPGPVPVGAIGPIVWIEWPEIGD